VQLWRELSDGVGSAISVTCFRWLIDAAGRELSGGDLAVADFDLDEIARAPTYR
jgi:hypothetical protein